MSILIKGMKMPKSCGDCPIGDSLCCSLMPGVPALWKEYTMAVRTNRRHSDCPLIEVPEDVQPVKHGQNIATEYDEVDQFVCSECGIELQNWVRVERDEDDGDETHHEYRFNFCPNCGADMRGE